MIVGSTKLRGVYERKDKIATVPQAQYRVPSIGFAKGRDDQDCRNWVGTGILHFPLLRGCHPRKSLMIVPLGLESCVSQKERPGQWEKGLGRGLQENRGGKATWLRPTCMTSSDKRRGGVRTLTRMHVGH